MLKYAIRWIVVLCLLSAIQGCYAPPPVTPPTQQTFAVQVRVDKPTYKVGEFIVLTVQASHDCYLSLYDTTTQGEVIQIFPNKYATDNLIKGGPAYRIPDATDNFDFEVVGPSGTERVRAVCTVENVNLIDNQKVEKTETFPKISQDRPGDFDKNMNQKLETIPVAQWTESNVTFQVVQ